MLNSVFDCFHMTAKCVIWILIQNAHFELKFDRVYAKLHRDASFEMRISNDGPEVFSSYPIHKSHSENHRMNALTSKLWFGRRS